MSASDEERGMTMLWVKQLHTLASMILPDITAGLPQGMTANLVLFDPDDLRSTIIIGEASGPQVVEAVNAVSGGMKEIIRKGDRLQ